MKKLKEYSKRVKLLEAKRPGSPEWLMLAKYYKMLAKEYLKKLNYELNPEDKKEIDSLCENTNLCDPTYMYFRIRELISRENPDKSYTELFLTDKNL